MSQSIQAGQINSTLQVAKSRLPALSVSSCRKVSLNIDNRLQRCFILVCTNIYRPVNNSLVIAKIFLFSRNCLRCQSLLCIIGIAALIEQLHTWAYTIITIIDICIIRIAEVRTFIDIIVCHTTGYCHILIVIVCCQILCIVIP